MREDASTSGISRYGNLPGGGCGSSFCEAVSEAIVLRAAIERRLREFAVERTIAPLIIECLPMREGAVMSLYYIYRHELKVIAARLTCSVRTANRVKAAGDLIARRMGIAEIAKIPMWYDTGDEETTRE